MFERAPNGFFVRDLIVFNHLRRGGYVAKGFVFEPPDLTNSPVADLNDFQEQLCLLLASLHEHQRLQVQYFCDSDYCYSEAERDTASAKLGGKRRSRASKGWARFPRTSSSNSSARKRA
ncbi:MAG TPA: hypothetical protein VNT99_16185 [Methylomirabilota bacterium]|nr:hypothetical protein [Methylomirabilota bacterium]